MKGIRVYVKPFDGDIKLVGVETLRGICPRRLMSDKKPLMDNPLS